MGRERRRRAKTRLAWRGRGRARFPLVAVWLGSLLILAAVVFREISVFLLRIEGSSNAYGPSVFTGWQLKASETDDLLAAAGPAGVWTTNPLADPFVSWHLSLDFLFVFVLGRCPVPLPRRRGRATAGADAVRVPELVAGRAAAPALHGRSTSPRPATPSRRSGARASAAPSAPS